MNRSELQASLLASFIDGRRLEYKDENAPARPSYVRHDPISKLLLAANLYTTEVHIDLNEKADIEKLYFCIRLPAQSLVAGQFFQYCDFPAIKMISRIEYYFKSYQQLVETHTTSSLYMQLFESLGQDQTWEQYVQDNLGGFDNSLNMGPCIIPETVWVVPLPLSLLPLRSADIGGDPDNRLFVRLVLNPIRAFTYCSLNFTLTDFIRAAPQSSGASTSVASECYVFAQTTEGLLSGPPKTGNVACSMDNSRALAGDYRSNHAWYTQAYSKSVAPKSEYFYAGNNNLLNELTLFPANPLFAGGRTFYGNYSMNALVNFLNTCVYNWNVQYEPTSDILLNLRTGNAINLPAGWSTTQINSTTYLFTSDNIRVLLVSVGLDWSSLTEDVFFDLRAFAANANGIPVLLLKNLFFYVKQAALERVTLNGLASGGNAGFVEGLYLTQDGSLALYGFQQVDFIDAMDEPARVFLRLTLAAPVSAGSALMTSFAKSKLVAISDPLYQHYDLDKSLRIGCSALTTRYADLETYRDTLTQFSWSDVFFQDYSLKSKYATNNLRAMFRFMPSNVFTYNTRERPNGFLDCVSNSLELQFNVGIYDAETNREIDQALTSAQIPTSNLGALIQSVYGSTVIAYDFVFKILRFVAFKGSSLEFFTGDPELVAKIITKFYADTGSRQKLARAVSELVETSKCTLVVQEQRSQKRVRLV